MRRNRSHAFSMVELLTVIAIIAILASLLLVAIQGVRASARRISCANNQRQVALAINNFESSHRRLPASGQVRKNRFATLKKGTFEPRFGRLISWAVTILPYLEEEQLYEQFDLTKSIFDQPNNAAQQHVGTYLCPADNAAERFFQHSKLTKGTQIAKGNYVAYVSPFHLDQQIWFPGALGGGHWEKRGGRDGDQHRGQKLSRIRDGVSNTVMITEVLTRDEKLDQRGAWALPWTAAGLLALDVHPVTAMLKFIKPRPDTTLTYVPDVEHARYAQLPNNTGPYSDVLYHCEAPDKAKSQNMPCARWGFDGPRYLSAAPRSLHPAGVVVAFMDGRTQFITNDIDPIVMAKLVSINDGDSNSKP